MQDFGEQEVAPHVQRMIDEYAELKTRWDKLAAFINNSNPIYEGLDKIDQALLQSQLQAMDTYKLVLTQRIERALGGK